jgi:tetratricopeptide (TPR) repeat protein
MSANLVRLRKRAAELEQKKQFDRALEVYVQILDEGGKDLDDEDVPLFNRVGDMLMRKGSVTEALGYYERAVDMYAERGYLNNAIALCSKILRQSPGRAAVYYKLARISARKGFKSDARKNFLEYADRMQKLGMADEAFRALKEFASLYPDQDDVRLILAELLSKENRKGEALEQLQSLYEKLQAEGRGAEARATVDRMRAIDPAATPREGTRQPTPAAVGDLVFLDLNDGDQAPTPPKSGSQPPSARAPVASPVAALTGLSVTFFPDEAETEAPHPEGFESTAVESEPVESTPVTRSLTPAGSELVVEPVVPGRTSQRNVTPIAPLDLMNEAPEPLERIEQALEDLIPEPAPVTRQPSRTPPPLSISEFATIDLDETPKASVDRGHDLNLPGELPETPEDVEALPVPILESEALAEDARAAAEEAAELAADIAAREAGPQPIPAEWEAPVPAEPNEPEELPPHTDAVLEGRLDSTPVEEIPDDFLSMPPSFGSPVDSGEDHVFPPLPGLEDIEELEEIPTEAVADQPELPAPAPAGTPRGTISIGSAESHLRSRLELDPENWELRRQLGEALLDSGDRDGGLYELELAMVGFELRGHADRAQEVVDVILKVSPASISHHQKRVEYAVRSRDRDRLTYSYLELADALFRSGAGDKAVAVYGRVLELEPGNERAEFALSTLAPEELVRLRGGTVRPERWTDELAAISSDGKPAGPVATAPPTAGSLEMANGAELPVKEVYPPPPQSQRVRFKTLELPVPDWGDGVPVRGTSPLGPRNRATPARQQSVVEPPAPPVARDEDLARQEAAETVEDLSPVADERPPSGSSSRIPTPSPVPEPRSLTPAAPASDRMATPLPAPAPRSPTPLSVPTPRSATPLSVPTPRSPTPGPLLVPRNPTPAPVPTTRTATPYSVPSPLENNDSDFIDLGEWLRNTEPVRSTRMQVEDPKPTGDEQADFEEMLRRFKRGVAENVEAEDYEAHYDLGVAYKEMGLIDEAIAQFQKALRDPNQRVRSYEALGQCFVEKEQYPIAAALLQRAIEVPGTDDQQLVGVLYLLGFATEHLGRPAEALPYYLRVFAVDIEFRDVAERVAALGKSTK